MRISCPQCSSQYNVDEKRIPPQGVQIKCPKCLHAFVVHPPGAEPADSTYVGGVPLPGGGGAVPLPGGGGGGAVPLPGGGGGGAVPLPGGGGGGAVPLPGGGASARGGAVPLPGGGGSGGVPLPGGRGGGAVPLPGGGGGGGVPLPGGRGAVPLPGGGGGGVPLPGGRGAVPLPGASAGHQDDDPFNAPPPDEDPFGAPPPSDDPFGGAPPAPEDPFGDAGPTRNAPPEDDPFGMGSPPPPQAAPGPMPAFSPSRSFGAEAAIGGSVGGSEGGRSENSVVAPFHGGTQARAPQQPAGQSMPLDGGVLDFIDRAVADSGPAARKAMFRIRKRSGKIVGPFDEGTVTKMLRSQELSGSEDCSEDGVSWKPLSQVATFSAEIQALMASALGGLGDLPAPGGGARGAPMGGMGGGLSDLPAPAMAQDLGAGLDGLEGLEPAAPMSGGKKEAPGKGKGGKGKVPGQGGFPVKLLAGVVGGLVVIGTGVVTAFVTPQHGLFFYKDIANLFSSSKSEDPGLVKQPVAAPVIPVFQADATVEGLLDEDNYASYVEAQKKLSSDANALNLARAYALPAYFDGQKEMAAKALDALSKAGGAEAKTLAAFKTFADLAAGTRGIDEITREIVTVAGAGPAELKDASEAARNGESWVQTAAGYALLQKGGKPDDALSRFDWALMAQPDNLVATLGQAKALLAANDAESAMGYLERAVALQKDNLRARILLGQQLLKANRHQGARVHLEVVTGITGAKGTPRQRAEARALMSEVAIRSRDFKEASDHLKQASLEVPDDMDMKVRSGDLLLRLREWPQARQAFDDILAAQPDFEPAIIGSARAKIGATDALGAFKQLQDASNKKPQSAALRFWFGQANEALGKVPEAVKQYKQAETLDPKKAAPVVAQAHVLLKERKYTDALNLVQPARGRVAPEEEQLLRAMLGQVYVKQRNYPLAFKEFEAALEKAPNNSEARALYGAALRDSGRFDEARKNLAQALEEDPKNAMILAEMGSYYTSQGQYERAIDLFQSAIGVAPKEADYYVRLGAATYSKGDKSGALEFLKNAQALAPNNPDVFYWMALSVRPTDPEKAKGLLKQGSEISPEDGRFDHELGRSMFADGSLVEAAEYLREAVRKEPSNGDAYFDLGRVYVEQARYADAREQFQRAVQLMPGKAFIRLNIAETYAKAGQYKDAAKEYQKAIAADSSLADAYCKLADVYRNDTNYKPAAQMYEKCTGLQPKHKEAWKQLGLVYVQLGGKPNQKKAVEAWKTHFRVNPEDPENDDLRDQMSDFR